MISWFDKHPVSIHHDDQPSPRCRWDRRAHDEWELTSDLAQKKVKALLNLHDIAQHGRNSLFSGCMDTNKSHGHARYGERLAGTICLFSKANDMHLGTLNALERRTVIESAAHELPRSPGLAHVLADGHASVVEQMGSCAPLWKPEVLSAQVVSISSDP